MTSAFWRAARTDVAPYVYEVVGDVLPAGFDSVVGCVRSGQTMMDVVKARIQRGRVWSFSARTALILQAQVHERVRRLNLVPGDTARDPLSGVKSVRRSRKPARRLWTLTQSARRKNVRFGAGLC